MVITLDKRKRPLGVCTERRARILLGKRRACVYRRCPFTIIIKDVDVRKIKPKDEFQVKIDPGAKTTGIAVVRKSDDAVVFYQQVEHRAQRIVDDLTTRRQTRRNRRSRETRYRRPKWGNKQLAKGKNFDSSRPKGWLPPSVQSIADNIVNTVSKLCRFFNISSCSFEAVRFDTQLMDNPNIESVDYQQGTLYGYEVKEYLLDKYGHCCQYCGGASGDSILEWEHIVPRAKGGSDSVKNATLACHTCNAEKGSHTLAEWMTSIKAKPGKTKLDEARLRLIPKVLENKPHGI